jgi:ATP-dependent Clp protease adaptor protein ClpS
MGHDATVLPGAAALYLNPCPRPARTVYSSEMADDRPKSDRAVLEKTRTKTREPELFSVILLNDDYTTMEFVVQVLESVFNKGPAEAFRIMMHVHTQGQGLCGVFPWDIAETKVAVVHELAQDHGFPLRAAIEKA